MVQVGKIKEVERLINNMEGEKGFLPFDEVNDIPPNDIVSSDQIDDVLMMFDEMDIDVVDDLQGLKVEEEKAIEKEEGEGEELVVRLMVHHPELIPAISGEGILREFESPILQKMAEKLEGLYQRKGKLDLTEALGCLEEDLKGRLCEFTFQQSGVEGGDQGKMLKDCIQKIREDRIKKERGELQKRIKEADKQQENKGLHPLLKQKLELARKRERGLQKDGIRKG